jgi:hypothetical protein
MSFCKNVNRNNKRRFYSPIDHLDDAMDDLGDDKQLRCEERTGDE